MDFLKKLDNQFAKVRADRQAERNKRREILTEKARALEADISSKFLKRVCAGKAVADVAKATEAIFKSIHGLSAGNLEVVKTFIQRFPTRLYYKRIPDFINLTGLGDFIAEVYYGRLFDSEGKPCRQKPEWISETREDIADFYYAVVSLLVIFKSIGASKEQMASTADLILDSYPKEIGRDERLERILEKVVLTGEYHLPEKKDNFPTAAYAASEKGDDDFPESSIHQRGSHHRRPQRAVSSIGDALRAKGARIPKIA